MRWWKARQESSPETTPLPTEPLCIFCDRNPRIKGDGGRVCWPCILMAGRWVAHPEEVGYDLAKALHEAHGDLVELRIAKKTEVIRGPFGTYRRQTGSSVVYWAFNDAVHVAGQVPPYWVEHPEPYDECSDLDCHVHAGRTSGG